MSIFRKIGYYISAVAAFTLSACSQIDDDLSDCKVEPEEEFELNYKLDLVTNMTTELKTRLNTVAEVEVSHALKDHLKGVFREFAHDVDLSFYDVDIDSVRLHHESHIMNDSTGSYTLNLPMREYMHLSSANIVDNSLVSIKDDDRCHLARLSQVSGDTINSHETGLFAARATMHVLGNVDQTIDVKLYMANAAAAIVVDTTNVKFKSFRAYSHGFATEFMMADSAYVYPEQSPYVRAKQIAVSDTLKQISFCTVSFPSRNPNGWWIRENADSIAVDSVLGVVHHGRYALTRAEGQIIPEGDWDENTETLWEYVIYVTLEDGSITKTTLEMKEPLLAGELKIIKAHMDSKGVVEPSDLTIGVSVIIDWKPGLDYENEL